VIHRLPALCALALVVLRSPAARAQNNSEDAWKGEVMRALNLASSGDYPKAEQAFTQALHEAEKFGAGDARVGTTLNSLGLVYRAEKKYSESESAYRKALVILERVYGRDSIDAANVNFNIASVLFDEGKQGAALPYLQLSTHTYETILGSTSLKTADVLCMTGDAYRVQREFKTAEDPLRRCADIREKNGGMQNPQLADALNSLALSLAGQGKYALAEPRFTLVERIREKSLGITSPLLAQTMEDHAAVLRQLGRDKEAARLETIVASIRRNKGANNAPAQPVK
jgi:tetratricopeptide (TPR) repeat protein